MLETLYSVSSASTVEEAHAILRRSHMDVALINRVLPDGRGADVAVFAKLGAAVIEMTGDPQEHIGLVPRGARTSSNRSWPTFCLRRLGTRFTVISDRLWGTIKACRRKRAAGK